MKVPLLATASGAGVLALRRFPGGSYCVEEIEFVRTLLMATEEFAKFHSNFPCIALRKEVAPCGRPRNK